VASSVRADQAEVAGETTTVTGVDAATIATVYRFRFSEGSAAALATLADGGAIVRRSFARAHDLAIGDDLRVRTPSDRTLDVRVTAILDPGAFDLDPLLGSVVLDQGSFDAAFPRPSDLYTFVHVDPASASLAGGAIAAGAERYPGLEVATRDEFIAARVSGIEQILNLLYVLLGLSVLVSLFGMVNTLVLAVFERTRELGMLRAIGLSRRQTRRTVRHEAIITALIGAALGLPLGVGLGALVTQALGGYGIELHLPVPTLAAFVGVALVAGVLAAVVPARRAGRLDVLEALQYE
jgi:putative ABC transport system permease protein